MCEELFCFHCSYSSKCAVSMKLHIDDMHLSDPEFICWNCEMSILMQIDPANINVSWSTSLILHLRSPDLCCEICNFRGTTVESCNKHKIVSHFLKHIIGEYVQDSLNKH